MNHLLWVAVSSPLRCHTTTEALGVEGTVGAGIRSRTQAIISLVPGASNNRPTDLFVELV
jgi:hypothetical protein